MIMPNKYLKEEDTLLGASAVIFENLSKQQSISELWDNVREDDSVYNFERFILSLDLLYMLNLVELNNNEIMRTKHDL